MAMALPGLSPFGQTFAQFIIWWQLHVKASRGFSTSRAASAVALDIGLQQALKGAQTQGAFCGYITRQYQGQLHLDLVSPDISHETTEPSESSSSLKTNPHRYSLKASSRSFSRSVVSSSRLSMIHLRNWQTQGRHQQGLARREYASPTQSRQQQKK